MIDDAHLLQRYLDERSQEAFAELVHRHLGLVHSAALRQLGGDEHAARDVAQIVFTKLACTACSLADHPSLAGWLYLATRNQAVKAVRGETRRRRRETESVALAGADSPAEAPVNWDRVAPLLDRAVCELQPREREAVLLRFFEDRPYADIARVQQSTEDAARMRVARALERLHGQLHRFGIVSTAAALELALGTQTALASPASLSAQISATAVAHAAAANPSPAALFMSATKTKLAVLAAATLAGLYVWTNESRANRATEAEIQRVETQFASERRHAAVTPANSSIDTVTAQQRDGPGSVSYARSVTASGRPLGAIPPATARASLTMLQDGTLQWDGEPIRFREFPDDLREFHKTHPEASAQVLIDTQAAPGPQLAYLFQQAIKAGIQGVWLGPASLSPITYPAPPYTPSAAKTAAAAVARARAAAQQAKAAAAQQQQ